LFCNPGIYRKPASVSWGRTAFAFIQLRLYGSSTVVRDGAGGGVVVWWRWSNVMELVMGR